MEAYDKVMIATNYYCMCPTGVWSQADQGSVVKTEQSHLVITQLNSKNGSTSSFVPTP